jgi:hypothetical protein
VKGDEYLDEYWRRAPWDGGVAITQELYEDAVCAWPHRFPKWEELPRARRQDMPPRFGRTETVDAG